MIKEGSKVKVHYTGRLTNNEVFDSSLREGREPLEFVVGEKSLIPGFENGVIGMSRGEKVTLNISPNDAYGEYRDDLRLTVPKTNVPQGIEVGQSLQANTDGQMIPFIVREVMENEVIVDANHPLAGQELIFDIEIVDIEN
jgi:FKBP-type peptidyl-prolyl cis-trans isomerase 2